jgi:hypothetical protein
MNDSDTFRKLVKNKFKFGLFMFKELPAAFFSGVRVKEISEERSLVSIPYKFLTKNPFKSVYFASQAMAAELSTGILALSYISGIKPRISMLVLHMRSDFTKKANSKISFECNDGLKIKESVKKCIERKEGVTVEVKSTGKNKNGDIISEFYFTWTFKQKG